jgi:prevent-host-death family protein
VKQVDVYVARRRFFKLLKEAEAGEEIVITRNGEPVVRLVPVRAPRRTLGRWKGQVPVPSEEAWRASDEALARLLRPS